MTSFRGVPSCLAALLAIGLMPAPAAAIDLSWSSFATFGYARSDEGFHYLRWIDDEGSFKNEAVAGLQLDLQLSARWSATLQLRVAPAMDDDDQWDVEPSWGFLAWRPADGWLLRAGRLRAPLYMYSEVLDVGVAHDMARLPVEMYTLTPVNEVIGASVSYDWMLDADGDYILNTMVYGGTTEADVRGWVPDGLPGVLERGEHYLSAEARALGLAFDLNMPDTRFRAGFLATRARPDEPTPETFPRVDLAPGLSFYKVAQQFPGPPIKYTNVMHNELFGVGVEHRFGGGWRAMAEYARILQHDTDLGTDSNGGYVAVFKEWRRFTPYLSYSRLTTTEEAFDLYRDMVRTQLPPGSLGGAERVINAVQAGVVAQSYVTDQQTLAVGTSVGVPGGKLKFEWAHTWIDETSRFVDELPGEPLLGDRQVNVWTVNYSVVF